MLAAILSITVVGAEEDLSLPDPLTTLAGDRVTTAEQWQQTRRPEVLDLFRTHVYGHTPVARPDTLRFELKQTDANAMDGMATLKMVDIHFSGRGGEGVIQLAVFVPNAAQRPAPGFVLICNRDRSNIDPTREEKSDFWPVERIVERGYVAAAFHNSDVDPDHPDGFADGVRGIFAPENESSPDDAWGTIAAWAWGASRVMDYFETDDDIDAARMGVVGHSRGGKASLWCGAEDQRFSLVISNNSGCSGAALARRKQGERVSDINRRFPHWFCGNYEAFNAKEDELPVDQHMLIALMAPRLVYVASASEDAWADPLGEFLACAHAGLVYELLGATGLGVSAMPGTNAPVHLGRIGYHLREGKHDLTAIDWDHYMDFADKYWGD